MLDLQTHWEQFHGLTGSQLLCVCVSHFVKDDDQHDEAMVVEIDRISLHVLMKAKKRQMKRHKAAPHNHLTPI